MFFSYLATLAEIDYLRSDWFYRHTPYGGLRYDYPEPALFALILVALIAAAYRWWGRNENRLEHLSPRNPQEMTP